MKFDIRRFYDSDDDFFSLGGSIVMKLSGPAAIAVCEKAAQNGLIISRVEGGIWHSPGFEARLDCIWDGSDPPLSSEEARENNLDAARFIQSEMDKNNVFILTAPKFEGL